MRVVLFKQSCTNNKIAKAGSEPRRYIPLCRSMVNTVLIKMLQIVQPKAGARNDYRL
jgi:hypothetical protein